MKLPFINKWKILPVEAKASVAYAVCSILQRSMSFITLPLFTRLLTTEEYGQASVYSSWSALVAVFISLYLPYGTFSTAMVKYEKRRDEYVASADAVCLLMGIIFVAIYYPFRQSFNVYFELPTYLILVMVMEIVANTAVQCWSAKQRYEYKYKSVIAVTLLLSVLSPIMAFIFVMNAEEKGYARILGGALVGVIVGAVFWLYNWKKGKHLYVKEFWHYALSFNIPLIPYYLSQMVFNQSDRIMISQLVGTDKAGIYNVACNLGMALTFVMNSINNSYVPWMYRKMKEGNWEANQSVSFFIALLLAALFLMIILFTPEIILILAGTGYYEAVWIVPPVTMSMLALLYSQFFINVQFYYKQRSNLVLGMISSGVVNVVLNYIFIPIGGFIVAAYTSLFCYIMNIALYYFFYQKIRKEKKMEELINVKKLFGLAVAFAISSGCAMLLYPYLLLRLVIIMMIISYAFHRREQIKDRLCQLK